MENNSHPNQWEKAKFYKAVNSILTPSDKFKFSNPPFVTAKYIPDLMMPRRSLNNVLRYSTNH